MSMEPVTDHPITVHRRRETDVRSVNDRRLRRRRDAGEIAQVVPGSYVSVREWASLTPRLQHLTRVLEVADRAHAPQVFTGSAAAAVWGIDRIGAWPRQVEVRIAKASGGRSSGYVRRRALGLDGVDMISWRGHLLTSPAQTALDVASDSSFLDGVVALDQVLWQRREGGALARLDQLWERLDEQWRRGMAKVPAMVHFSTCLSDSVRESEARVLMDRLGFPAPVLQKKFVLPSGRVAYPDFYFPDFDHAAEFDGTGKYFDQELRAGRSPAEVLMAEKDREDELRRCVRAVSRWRTPAHRDARLLYDILTVDGLPSRLPRPRAAELW